MLTIYRFSVGMGIAGYVAETGETVNICDAYKDPRFNAAIDEQTGYTTQSILCMPICIRGQVIGVMEMVNKLDGMFTTVRYFLFFKKIVTLLLKFKDDEEAFEMFSVYAGLALHHAKLYDKIRRSEQKYKVSLEVLSYHNSSSADEVDEIVLQGHPDYDPNISK